MDSDTLIPWDKQGVYDIKYSTTSLSSLTNFQIGVESGSKAYHKIVSNPTDAFNDFEKQLNSKINTDLKQCEINLTWTGKRYDGRKEDDPDFHRKVCCL